MCFGTLEFECFEHFRAHSKLIESLDFDAATPGRKTLESLEGKVERPLESGCFRAHFELFRAGPELFLGHPARLTAPALPRSPNNRYG
jgi:hypothetical protein